MARLTLNGKTAKDTAVAVPATPPRQKPPTPQEMAAAVARYGEVNGDPFTIDTTQTPELRASSLADTAVWLDQFVADLNALVWKARRLADKLADPSLADSPFRADAARDSRRQNTEIAERAADIVWTEAHADRVWQSLSIQQRRDGRLDLLWNVPSTQQRLIGVAWTVMGARHAWPLGWRIRREWVAHFPLVILLDLRLAKVYRWEPNPYPPSIFDGTQAGETPAEIAAQIADEKGNPK